MRIILMKFTIITLLTLAYVFVAAFIIAPAITQVAFGQFNTPDQFNNPQQFGNNQFDNNQQFGNNQFDQNQYQQPYQSFQQPYGTPTYMPQQQYGPYPPQQGYAGFGIQEIITALIAGGGSAIYTKRRTSQLHDDNQLMMSEILKGKQIDAELARITYNMNKAEADKINDAPTIKLENLQNDVNQFTEKAAKA